VKVLRLLVVIAVFAAGCTASGDPTGSGADRETITDFIPGALAFDEASGADQFRALEQKAQESIAKCMAEQGFDYIPYVESQSQGGFMEAESEEEFVDLYGFGIATSLLADQEMDEEAMDEEMARNPNYAIEEALSDAEREAYSEALYGAQPDIDFENMTEEEIDAAFAAFEAAGPTGCMDTAYSEVYEQGADQAFYEEFGSALEDTFANIESDPRIAELESQWSTCMADRGYDYATQGDIEKYLLHRLEDAGAITDLEISPDGGGFGYGSEGIEPGSPMEDAVKEIAAEEVAIAKDALACSKDQEKVYREVYEEAEQRFIDEHRAELEQFKKDHS